MTSKEIFSILQEKFGDKILGFFEGDKIDPFVNVSPDSIKEICMFLRDETGLEFDYLANLTGMDYKDSLGVVYHLYSIKHNHYFVLKVTLDRTKPMLPTVERVWKTANWHEREVYDMFGVIFLDHPDLQRILCPDDWEGFPLRKDYVAPTEYHGIDATSNKLKETK